MKTDSQAIRVRAGETVHIVIELRIAADENREGQVQPRAVRAAPASVPDKTLLTIREVCQLLGMQKTFVYRLLKSGALPSLQIGRARRVRREAVEAYLRRSEVGP